MLINSKISNQKSLQKQNFGQDKSEVALPSNPSVAKPSIDLNNTPSIQNKVIVKKREPEYKELQTFSVPNVGEGKMYKLKTGHRVLILPKKGSTNIYTYVKVGAFDEPKEKKGISHFLEHLTCSDEFSKKGVVSNASTNICQTIYYEKFFPQDEADFEANLKNHASILTKKDFSDEAIERERKVVTAEALEGMPSVPGKAYTDLPYEHLFGKNSCDFDVAGTPETIKNITKQDILAHYNKFYTPQNMVTVIVGEVEPEKTIKLVSKYFNEQQQRKTASWETNSYPDMTHHLQSTKRADLKIKGDKETHLQLSFVGPMDTPQNLETGYVLSNIININRFEKYKKDFDLSADIGISSVFENSSNPMKITLRSDFKKSENEEKGLRELYSILSDVAQQPISDKEFLIAKNERKRAFLDNENSATLAEYLGDKVLYGQSPNVENDRLNVIDSITKEDVQDFAKKYLDLNKASIVISHPEETGTVTFGAQKHFSQIDLSAVNQYQLNNNALLLVDTSQGVSKTYVELDMPCSEKPKQNQGAYMILNELLNKNQEAFNNNTDGITIGLGADSKTLSAHIRCDDDKIIPAINQMNKVLLSPTFSKEDFEEEKRRLINNVKELKPREIYSKEDELFGDDNWLKSNKNLENVRFEDVIGLHKEILANAQARIVVVMPQKAFDKSKGEIFNALNKDIPTVKKFQRIEPEKPKSLDKNYVLVDVPTGETKQASVIQNFRTPNFVNAKDRAARDLLSFVLGGGLESRLSKDLRAKQGIVYSPYSTYEEDKFSLVADANAEEHPENLQKIVESFGENTRRLMEQPVSKEELDRAKNKFVQELLTLPESSQDQLDYFSGAMDSPYGKNAINEKLKALDEITPEHIQKMAQLIFENNSVTHIATNQKALDANKKYLETKGEVSIFDKD